MKLYLSSNELFSTLLEYIDSDSAEYNLFEGTNVLFFPNLLCGRQPPKNGANPRCHGAQENGVPPLEAGPVFGQAFLGIRTYRVGFRPATGAPPAVGSEKRLRQ